MKNLICYISIICMLMPACKKKTSYHIPQYAEEGSDSVACGQETNENTESASPQKQSYFVQKKELANDYGWIVYIDGKFNPNDSCYSDFKLYIEDQQTQEERIFMESIDGQEAKLPIRDTERSYRTVETIKEVHLLSSKRMFILEEGLWHKEALIVDIESLSIIKEIPSFDEFTGFTWDGLEFKTIDAGTMEHTRIFTRRYNHEGELVYEDETIIKYDNPNPVIPKETNTLSNKIKEYTSNLPINAEKIAEGYDWIVYKQEMPDDDEWCDAVKLYIENKNSHKLYLLLETSCGSQESTGIDVLNEETNKYEYQSDFFYGYWEEVEVLSPSRIFIGISDARHINCSIIDLETFSAIYIGAFRWGLSVTHENGQTYLDHSSCNQRLGKYQFWSSRYDIYGNLLHEEVKTILYPPDYQIEGDCW